MGLGSAGHRLATEVALALQPQRAELAAGPVAHDHHGGTLAGEVAHDVGPGALAGRGAGSGAGRQGQVAPVAQPLQRAGQRGVVEGREVALLQHAAVEPGPGLTEQQGLEHGGHLPGLVAEGYRRDAGGAQLDGGALQPVPVAGQVQPESLEDGLVQVEVVDALDAQRRRHDMAVHGDLGHDLREHHLGPVALGGHAVEVEQQAHVGPLGHRCTVELGHLGGHAPQDALVEYLDRRTAAAAGHRAVHPFEAVFGHAGGDMVGRGTLAGGRPPVQHIEFARAFGRCRRRKAGGGRPGRASPGQNRQRQHAAHLAGDPAMSVLRFVRVR
mmetsp:Transcript_6281/g.25360  ORF Transcript_6281/g.25360 Transcript_6281/m.25360 type:complete len:327 (+) Transcript_6281:3482-4462(+)